MPTYEIEFDYVIDEGGAVTLEAQDADQAEYGAQDYIKEFYPDARDVEIVSLKEVEDII